jgi:aminomethyltransferase
MAVLVANQSVGTVLSGAMSPVLNKPIGSALVDRAALDGGAELAVDLRGAAVPLRVARPPLHKTAAAGA